jgi:hypothetical protein
MAETVPPDALVGLILQDGVRELSADESRRVLERYPELFFQYRKFRGMTRTSGRLIVIDRRRVSAILTWLDSA